MNVLWMTYAPIGAACEALGTARAQSGSWVDATARALAATAQPPRLAVATLAPGDTLRKAEKDGVTYYCIPGGHAHRGARAPGQNVALWRQVVEDFHPDLIQIWGSEFTDGLDLLDAAPGVPAVLYTQGVITAIDKYPNGGLPLEELRAAQPLPFQPITLKYRRDAARMAAQVPFEQELARRVGCIITDNEWCAGFFRAMAPETAVAYHMLPMNEAFQGAPWTPEGCVPHTIFCNAGRTPYKGIHMAVRALARIRPRYPDVKLRIPGAISFDRLDHWRTPPYFRYLARLAEELGVRDCLEFPGVLTSAQMAEEMRRAHVFVMPSAIENLSTTLREAMLVGTPAVSASVGCVPEYLHHGENGYLYRYEEYELLAQYVMRLFAEPDKAAAFSAAARQTIRRMYVREDAGEQLAEIYRQVLQTARG